MFKTEQEVACFITTCKNKKNIILSVLHNNPLCELTLPIYRHFYIENDYKEFNYFLIKNPYTFENQQFFREYILKYKDSQNYVKRVKKLIQFNKIRKSNDHMYDMIIRNTPSNQMTKLAYVAIDENKNFPLYLDLCECLLLHMPISTHCRNSDYIFTNLEFNEKTKDFFIWYINTHELNQIPKQTFLEMMDSNLLYIETIDKFGNHKYRHNKNGWKLLKLLTFRFPFKVNNRRMYKLMMSLYYKKYGNRQTLIKFFQDKNPGALKDKNLVWILTKQPIIKVYTDTEYFDVM